jgi:hypothetical protein
MGTADNVEHRQTFRTFIIRLEYEFAQETRSIQYVTLNPKKYSDTSKGIMEAQDAAKTAPMIRMKGYQ